MQLQANQGNSRKGKAIPGKASKGNTRQFWALKFQVRQGRKITCRQGNSRQDKAKQSRQGKIGKGNVILGKAIQAKLF